jgi:hypothetical protein
MEKAKTENVNITSNVGFWGFQVFWVVTSCSSEIA